MMDDVHLSTARHFCYKLRPVPAHGGKFSAAIWSAGGVPRITNNKRCLTDGLFDQNVQVFTLDAVAERWLYTAES